MDAAAGRSFLLQLFVMQPLLWRRWLPTKDGTKNTLNNAREEECINSRR
jgi:hypothetical protein